MTDFCCIRCDAVNPIVVGVAVISLKNVVETSEQATFDSILWREEIYFEIGNCE